MSPKTYDQIAPIAAQLRQSHTELEVAAMVGLSRTRLRNVLAKAQRDAAMPAWTAGLDIRTANLLLAADLASRDQVREAI